VLASNAFPRLLRIAVLETPRRDQPRVAKWESVGEVMGSLTREIRIRSLLRAYFWHVDSRINGPYDVHATGTAPATSPAPISSAWN